MSRRFSRMLEDDWFGNNRHLCDVLEDMRKCVKTQNFSPLRGLIEEAQIMGSRMESALSDQKDLVKLNGRVSEIRREYKKLKAEYKELLEKKKELAPDAEDDKVKEED